MGVLGVATGDDVEIKRDELAGDGAHTTVSDDAVVQLQDRDPLRDQGPFGELAVTGRLWSGATALSDDYVAINKLLTQFVDAVNTGDAKAWADLMTEDIIFSVPAAPR